MNIRKKFSLGLALLAVGASVPALAIPVAFDFTGTVQSRIQFDGASGTYTPNTVWDGLEFSARMVIETDRYMAPLLLDQTASRTWFSTTGATPPSPWFGDLQIGGTSIDVRPYELNHSYIQREDSKGVLSCGVECYFGVPDSLMIVTRSEEISDGDGINRSSLFQLNAFEHLTSNPADSTYVDLDQTFDVASLLTLALPNLSFLYGTSAFDCVAGLCHVAYTDTTRFNITAVTRSDLSATSVPEPGTLGLLVAGLFAAGFGRRKLRRA